MSSRRIAVVAIGIIFGSAAILHAQTATYHLHKEASATSGLYQLKTANPDAGAATVASTDLKNQAPNEYMVKAFDTQAGVPNLSGTIAAGSSLSVSLHMRKTAAYGTMYPRAKVALNSIAGAALCTATGATALTTTVAVHTLTCTTSAAVTVTTSDRFYLWVGIDLTAGPGGSSVKAELKIEGTAGGNYDSSIVVPLPSAAPTISDLSPASGTVGTGVTIAGTNFGASQGSSSVRFNGTTATPTSWSATSIQAPVPSGATTGPVVVTVGGLDSNGVTFTVGPQITGLSPGTGTSGTQVTISGSNFGATQGASTITFDEAPATPSSWSDTAVITTVPAGASTGVVVVTVNGLASNGMPFSIPPTVDNVSPSSGPVGTMVTVTGASFGETQGTSGLTFNGTPATPATWSKTRITTPVPAGATSGQVAVTVGGTASNPATFTVLVPPTIASLSRTSGPVGVPVTVTGSAFGAAQGASSVTFNGVPASTTSWDATSIVATVPPGASSGPVVVHVEDLESNGVPFSITSEQITLVYDTFTGANGTALSAHNPDVNVLNRPWTMLSGPTPVLSGGRLTGTSPGDTLAVVDTGTADGTIRVWGAGSDSALVFRATDAQNFFLLRLSNGRIYLHRVRQGQWTTLLNWWLQDGLNSGTLQVVLSGPSITISLDIGYFVYATGDDFNANARLHGVRWAPGVTSTIYDEFIVWGTLPQAPTTVAIAPSDETIVFEGPTKTLTATGFDAGGNPIAGLTFDWSSSNAAVVEVNPTTSNRTALMANGIGDVMVTATPVFGPSATAVVTASPGPLLIADYFSGANGTSLNGHPPTVNVPNHPWTLLSGAWPVMNDGRLTASVSASTFALIDTGTPDVRVHVWASGPSATFDGGLVFRATDAQNFFLLRLSGGRLYLYRVRNGQWDTLLNWALDTGFGGGWLQVELSGPSITVSYDLGFFTYATGDPFNANARLFGVRWTPGGTSTIYDNFRVYGTLPPVPTTVAITPAAETIVFDGPQRTLTATAYDAQGAPIPGVVFDWTSSHPAIVAVSPSNINQTGLIANGTGQAVITAIPDAGPSATATVTVTPGGVLVFDTFTGADGMPLVDHGPEVNQVGGPWAVIGPMAPVLSGGRAGATGSPASTVALINAGAPDVTVRVHWSAGGGAVDSALLFRASDAQNHFRLRVAGLHVSLSRVEHGQETLLFDHELAEPQLAGWLEATTTAEIVTVSSSDGWSNWVTDRFNINAAQYGVRWVTAATSYDFFRVLGTLPPPATRVVVTPAVTTVPFHDGVGLTATAYDAADQVIPGTNFVWSTADPGTAVVKAVGNAIAMVTGMGEGSTTITATPARGPSGTASVTVDPGELIVYDSFTASNGTALPAHWPELTLMDYPWEIIGAPAPVITDGRPVITSNNGISLVVALIEGGAPDATVSTVWTPGTDEHLYGALVARATDEENHLVLGLHDDGVTLWRVIWGNAMAIGGATLDGAYMRNQSHRVELRLVGPLVQVWLDGSMQFQVNEPFNQGASKHGLKWQSWVNQVAYDEFWVKGALPPMVHTLSVSPTSVTLAPYESVTLTALARDADDSTLPSAVAAWSVDNTSIGRIYPSSSLTGRFTAVSKGVSAVTARIPRGIADAMTVEILVEMCVDPLSTNTVSVHYGTNTFAAMVTAPTGCSWQAVPLVPWLSVVRGATGIGDEEVLIAVSPNHGQSNRIGQIAIGGQLLTVTQMPAPNTCVRGLSPGQTAWPAKGGEGQFGVVADPECQWLETSSEPSWLVPLEGFGSGSAAVRYRVLPNTTGAPRMGSIGLLGGGFEITQAGGTLQCSDCDLPPTCDFLVFVIPETPLSGRLELVGPSSCPWTASSDVSWLTVWPSSGMGPASVHFEFSSTYEGPGFEFTVLHVAGQTVTLGDYIAFEASEAIPICIPPPPDCGIDRRFPFCWPLCFVITPPKANPPRQPDAAPFIKVSPGTVIRGETVSAGIAGGDGAEVRSWKFESDEGTVQSSSSSRLWIGPVVTSGRISARVRWNGADRDLDPVAVTVLPRTSLTLPPVPPTKVANGTDSIVLPDPPVRPPQGGHTPLGGFYLVQPYTYTYRRVQGGSAPGPNEGFFYVSGVSPYWIHDNQRTDTKFSWAITRQADTPGSPFYSAQCGDYHPVTNPLGFIQPDVLRTNIVEHESGLTNGHYAFYRAAQASDTNNLGRVGEAVVALTDEVTFKARVNEALNIAVDEINGATAVEACQGDAERDAGCNFRGHINWPPYAGCQP